MKKYLLTLSALCAGLALQPAMAQDAETLYNTKACVACHKIDVKVVGPSYKEVAARYATQADAATYLAGKIKNGSQNVWGPIPMPANAVTEDEARILATWILSQK